MRRLVLLLAALVTAGPQFSIRGAEAGPPGSAAPAVGEAAAEGATRVVVEAEVWGEGRTPAEARREVQERARALAVERVAGIRVSAQDLRLRSESADGTPVDAFASLVRTSTWGRIVRESVEHETVLVDGVPVYRVRLEADVRLEQGEPDPGFSLAIASRPDRHTYRDGESLALELTASRDCFVHLFNVLPDGRVVHLDAATVRRPVRLAAGKTARLPEPGTVLRAKLGAGLARAHEQVLAVATLDAVPLLLDVSEPSILTDAASPGHTPGSTNFTPPATIHGALPVAEPDSAATWSGLNRWLMGIPVDRRTEVLWSYEVLP